MAFFGYVPVTFLSVLFALILSLALVLGGFIIFKIVWVNKSVFVFPRKDQNEGDTDDLFDPQYMKLKGFWNFFGKLTSLLYKLDKTYWTNKIGYEGNHSIKQPTVSCCSSVA